MKKSGRIVPIVGLFGVGLLTYTAIRCLCDSPLPRPTRAATAISTGRAQSEAARKATSPADATTTAKATSAPPSDAPTPPPDSLVPQTQPGPDRSTVDGAPLREAISSLLSAAKFDELEARVNAASTEELLAALDSEGTWKIEDLFAGLPVRGRRLAAWVLSKSTQANVSGFLALQLRTEADEEVRQSIVLALQARHDDEAGRGIRSALEGDPSTLVRASAAYALGERASQDRASMEALVGRLGSDGDVQVRAACATAIGQSPSAAAASALLCALDAPTREVRLAAAQALGRQDGFAKAEELAARAQAEKDAEVRSALGEAQLALRKQLTIDMVEGCDREKH